MTREELIAALEKASKPSRELDGYIYMLTLPASRRRPVSWEVTLDGMIWAWTQNSPHAPGTGGWWATPPEYTASIDAALTLVPEGWRWFVNWAAANVWRIDGAVVVDTHKAQHITPAIALCIAAIRASAVEVADE